MRYKTRDMNLAAYLWVIGYPPKTEIECGQVWFTYGKQSLRSLKDGYYRGVMIPAYEYAQKIKQCKNLIHKALENNRNE